MVLASRIGKNLPAAARYGVDGLPVVRVQQHARHSSMGVAWALLSTPSSSPKSVPQAVLQSRRSESLRRARIACVASVPSSSAFVLGAVLPIALASSHTLSPYHHHHHLPACHHPCTVSPSPPVPVCAYRLSTTRLLSQSSPTASLHPSIQQSIHPSSPGASRRHDASFFAFHGTPSPRRLYTHIRPSLSHCLRAHTTIPPILHLSDHPPTSSRARSQYSLPHPRPHLARQPPTRTNLPIWHHAVRHQAHS